MLIIQAKKRPLTKVAKINRPVVQYLALKVCQMFVRAVFSQFSSK